MNDQLLHLSLLVTHDVEKILSPPLLLRFSRRSLSHLLDNNKKKE
jgi:hypothetical protein